MKQVKAYMSEPRHYDVCPCPMQTHYYLGTSGALGATCIQQAEAEARAILGETEPEAAWDAYMKIPGGVPGPWARLEANPFVKGSAPALALAESLAAWIGEGF